MDAQKNVEDPNEINDPERNQHLNFMQTCETCWNLLPNYIKIQVVTYVSIAAIVYGGMFLTRDDAPLFNEVYDTPARAWSCSSKGSEYTLLEVRSERDTLNALKEWMVEGDTGSTFSYSFPVEIEKGILDILNLQITKNYLAGGTVEFEILPIFTEEQGFYDQVTLNTGRQITVTDSINAIRDVFEKNKPEDSSRLFYVIPHDNEYVTRFEILPNNIKGYDDIDEDNCGHPSLVNLRNSISLEIEKTVKATE